MEQALSIPKRAHLQAPTDNPRLAGLRELLDILRRRKALLVLGLLLVYSLGTLYYVNQERVYEARACVLVHRTGDTLAGKGLDVPDRQYNYLPTHIQLISSSSVLNLALQHLQENDATNKTWPTVDQMAKGLKVTAQKDTEILEIRYQTPDRARAARVVQAVVNSYQDFVNETHRSTSKEILQILTQQKKDLDEQLRVKEGELMALQQKEGVLALHDGKSDATSHLTSLSQALTQARVRRLEVEGRLQALHAAITRGDMIESYLLPYLDRIGRDVVVRKLGLAAASDSSQVQEESVRRDLLRDEVELQRLEEIYGPNHPLLRAQKERMRLLSDSLNQTRGDPAEKARTAGELQALAIHLQEQDCKEAKKVELDLEQQYESEKRKAVEFTAHHAPFLALETELGRLRNYYDALINRIREVNVGGDYAAITTRVIEPPQEPTAPISPNPNRIALLCTAFGLLFGVGLCYLFDWWDARYRSPEEIARHLGLPVIGHVPCLARKLRDKPFELITYSTSKSVEAEAFRSLRTALMLCDSPPKKFTITSASPGDGKTSIITNLAISFAQSGLRTLVIDADLRRPTLSQVFGLQNTTGLAQLLGENSLTQDHLWAALCSTQVERLEVLPSGVVPANPAELLTSVKLGKILAWAESRYDRILCDAPPILAVSDSAILSRVLDGVLFVVHADKNDRQTTSRAREALERMNCPVLGVIVNAVQSKGAYGYHYYYESGFGLLQCARRKSGKSERASSGSRQPGGARGSGQQRCLRKQS